MVKGIVSASLCRTTEAEPVLSHGPFGRASHPACQEPEAVATWLDNLDSADLEVLSQGPGQLLASAAGAELAQTSRACVAMVRWPARPHRLQPVPFCRDWDSVLFPLQDTAHGSQKIG